eukprot:594919_1
MSQTHEILQLLPNASGTEEERKYSNEQELAKHMRSKPNIPHTDEDDGDESTESKSCYTYGERKLSAIEQMPTYIHKAIWFRSDDETLERLVDRAVTVLCNDTKLWNNAEFIDHLYDARSYEGNVDNISKGHFEFFDKFVQKTFRRDISLQALHEQNSDSDDDSPIPRDTTQRVDYESSTHKVHYAPKRNQREEKEDLKDACGYHIYSANDGSIGTEICPIVIDVDRSRNMSAEFEWAVWKNCGKALRKKMKKTGSKQKTYGLWEILNCPTINDWNKRGNKDGTNSGVPIDHLNIIFELLQWCEHYREHRRARSCIIELEAQISQLADDPLLATYCADLYEPRKVNIDMYIHGDRHTSHYVLTWWNCKTRTACNAIAIKNMTMNKDMDQVKEKYYMRFKVSELTDEPEAIEWKWYDNDATEYKSFSDYQLQYDGENTHKAGLLHKQIEATYQANIDENFPWRWFDKFNGAQLSHLAPALTTNGLKTTSSYLVRFTRLSYGETQQKETDEEEQKKQMRREKKAQRIEKKRHDLNRGRHSASKTKDKPPSVHIILSMEQVAVNKNDNSLFPRILKRLKNGKNSLKAQYSGSEPFVKNWLNKYQLETEAQQKYFWAFMLSIATKIKLMDIEVENQLVTIPIQKHLTGAQPQSLFSTNGAAIAQEQQDALLYKGFLVPPVLGEVIADAIQGDTNASISDVRQSIENRSKTRVLKKSKVKEQILINDDDEEFVYVHEVYDDQYLEREANLFRFAEIVRKFIIESKHLKNDSSLWPYYRNNSHIEDHDIYHTLVNRFNLSLMFTQHNIFQLFETQSDDESIGCWRHFCNDCCLNKPNDAAQDAEQIAIRHRRKHAATLLLQRWNTLRNLNVLRHQLIVIFNHIDNTMIEEVAPTFKWKDQIQTINEEFKTNMKFRWRFLSKYGNLKDNNPIEISVEQYPLFESFCATFLFEQVRKDRADLINPQDNQWFREFKQAWSAVPHWWQTKHDLILLELALKYNTNHTCFTETLRGEKAFHFRMRLKDRANYLEFTHFCGQSSNILHRLAYITHILVDEITKIKPSLVDIRVPPKQREEYNYRDKSFIFSDYDKKTHLQYVNNPSDEIEIYKPASKQTKEDHAEYEKWLPIIGPTVNNIAQTIRAEWPEKKEKKKHTSVRLGKSSIQAGERINTHSESERSPLMIPLIQPHTSMEAIELIKEVVTDEELKTDIDAAQSPKHTHEEEDEEEVDDETDKKDTLKEVKPKKKKISIDPFISRDLETELYEVINAFDVMKYGLPMALFVIHEITEFAMDELWTILGVVMEAMPCQMAEMILYSKMESLSRATTRQLETLCLKIVNGTNWKITSALRMAEYFKQIAEEDTLQSEDWMRISFNFENIAHNLVHKIESDHLLHLLLTVPLQETDEPINIIKLALEQKRTSFLNNDRILNVINHIWYHGPSLDIKQKELKPDSLPFSELLPILFFTPFKFYMLPIGYNFTRNILFAMYLIYVLWYSFRVVNETATAIWDTVLWILALGFILYEISEWRDKGREYCSVNGLMNVWDIMISVLWIVLFIMNVLTLNAFADRPGHEVLLKAYTLFFGLQIFLLSTRFLTLFQNTQYLGGLLKIVQMMAQEIFKFFSVATVVIVAFTFAFYFIYGLEGITDDDTETPVGFWETILFSFDLFIDGGTNNESYVGALFTVFLTVCGGLVLTNLLIALMTTKYEDFQKTAQEEVNFMQIESVIDLAYRDRLMPPPLNVIVCPLAFIIHLFMTLGALLSKCCSTCTWCNCYSRINRGTYVCLNTCYCGCNTSRRRFYAVKKIRIPLQKQEDDLVQNELYKMNCCSLCKEVSGISWCVRCSVCECPCDENNKREESIPLTAYHKGCYNCIKLKVNECDRNGKITTTVRGITMKDYIYKYEHEHGVKLHLADTILLIHLTADTLFCNYCFQPYLEDQVDKSLLHPFRVLMDVISCFAFLFTAWLPLVLFFVLMAIIEQLKQCVCCQCGTARNKRRKLNRVNKYEEFSAFRFDREYFPHSEAHIARPK